MAAPQEWTPILWPDEWRLPALLDLVKGTAFNCIAIPRSGPGSAPQAVVERAREAGLDVVILSDSSEGPPGLPTIRRQSRDRVDWTSGPIIAIGDGVWPKVAVKEGSDALDAGPTGLPWIDSNGWFIQLAKAKAPGTPIWLHYAGGNELIRSAQYAVAASDCEAYGARWLVTLDSHLRAGLESGNKQAEESWRALTQALSFFRETQAQELVPQGFAGALSDFSGDTASVSHEFLNLIAREYTPTKVLLKSSLTAASLEGLRMVVYLDDKPLSAGLKSMLSEFIRHGGTLITGPAGDPGLGSAGEAVTGIEYDVRCFGKGRLAVSREPLEDPYQVATSAHVLLGRQHDLVRLANAGSMNVAFTAAPDGKRARLHIVNYAGRTGLNPVTVTLLGRYRFAKFRDLERTEPMTLPLRTEYGRTALYLPGFRICAVLDLEM